MRTLEQIYYDINLEEGNEMKKALIAMGQLEIDVLKARQDMNEAFTAMFPVVKLVHISTDAITIVSDHWRCYQGMYNIDEPRLTRDSCDDEMPETEEAVLKMFKAVKKEGAQVMEAMMYTIERYNIEKMGERAFTTLNPPIEVPDEEQDTPSI